MDRVAMDIVGPFPLSSRGNKYILVVQDHFTKWTEAYALPDYTAKTVAQAFVYEFVSRFGAPLEVHTDQGRNFEAELFKEMCRLLGSHKTRTSPYRPCSNGSVERFNSTLLKMITAYVSQNQNDWDQHLPLLTAAYRSSEQRTTQFTPNQLMLGREVMLPIHVVFGISDPGGESPWYDEYVSELQDRMNQAFSLVREHFKAAQRTQKEAYDTRVSSRSYQQGDAVYTRDDTKKIGKSPKLKTDPWKGPYIITRRFSAILFEVQGHPRSKPRVLHHDRLKPFPEDALPSWARKLQEDHRPAIPQEPERLEQSVQTESRRDTAGLLETHRTPEDGLQSSGSTVRKNPQKLHGKPSQKGQVAAKPDQVKVQEPLDLGKRQRRPEEETQPDRVKVRQPQKQGKKMSAPQHQEKSQPDKGKFQQPPNQKRKKRLFLQTRGQTQPDQGKVWQAPRPGRKKKTVAPWPGKEAEEKENRPSSLPPRKSNRQPKSPERFGNILPSELLEDL